jgi:hypothetical protein
LLIEKSPKKELISFACFGIGIYDTILESFAESQVNFFFLQMHQMGLALRLQRKEENNFLHLCVISARTAQVWNSGQGFTELTQFSEIFLKRKVYIM